MEDHLLWARSTLVLASLAISCAELPPPPPDVAFTSSRTRIEAPGESVILTWTVSGADFCIASGAWEGPKSFQGQESFHIDEDQGFELTCSGAGGTVSEELAVVVVEMGSGIPPPSIVFSSTGSSPLLEPGSVFGLKWKVTDADSCEASGDWRGPRPLIGSEEFFLYDDGTFFLTCSGPGGMVVDEVSVSVAPASLPAGVDLADYEIRVTDGEGGPNIQGFWVSDTPVSSGSQISLHWNVTNADRCVASDGWSGPRPLTGNEPRRIEETTTFRLKCFGPMSGFGQPFDGGEPIPITFEGTASETATVSVY